MIEQMDKRDYERIIADLKEAEEIEYHIRYEDSRVSTVHALMRESLRRVLHHLAGVSNSADTTTNTIDLVRQHALAMNDETLDALIEQAEMIARDKALQQCRETLTWIHFAARGDSPKATLAEVAEEAGKAIDYAQRMLSRWDDDGKD